MKNEQIKRMESINELIKIIAENTRNNIFQYQDGICHFIALKTTVNFKDVNSGYTIAVSNISNGADKFGYGGVMWSIVNDFKLWIMTGKKSNGKNGYGGIRVLENESISNGYPKIIKKAISIGYLS